LRFDLRVLKPATKEFSLEGSTYMLMPWHTLSVDAKPNNQQRATGIRHSVER
jgi:hypothetical protein